MIVESVELEYHGETVGVMKFKPKKLGNENQKRNYHTSTNKGYFPPISDPFYLFYYLGFFDLVKLFSILGFNFTSFFESQVAIPQIEAPEIPVHVTNYPPDDVIFATPIIYKKI